VVVESPARILIVDDDRNSRESLRRALERDGHRVHTAEDGKAALAVARSEELDLVLTDLIMPGLGGLAFLEGLRVIRPDVPAILISAFANVDTAVKAVQRGVSDVLEKPIRLRDVRKAVKRAMEGRPLARSYAGVLEQAPEPPPPERQLGRRRLVGRSPAFRELLDMVERVGATSSTALLLGESGTGKELIAEALHAASPRSAGPLVKVACAALSEGVLEAELFGSERGAYTGSVALRRGRFELAHGGTLFLDEIGDLPLALQVKLLRVLQEGEFERVGGESTLRVDVRVLAATHRDLEAEVRAGRFREDLYWRLNVIPIPVPPLRERGEDVLLLAEHVLRAAREALGRTQPEGFSPEATALLLAYRWPGNVRELENAVERAVVLARTPRIVPDDLPAAIRRAADLPVAKEPPAVRFEVGQTLEQLEREAIRRTLEAVDGNREAAASILGIGLATLYRRLKEMGEEESGPTLFGPDTV
jgi:DNA-binding NtrC family response regulator